MKYDIDIFIQMAGVEGEGGGGGVYVRRRSICWETDWSEIN